MIAVIADDFTGAAEIGGVGLKHGLNVLLETEVTGKGNPDLLVVVADSRSKTVVDAKARIEKITSQLLDLKPRFIFKKIDSVLRGNVYEELITQQDISKKDNVLVVPANPHFERIIKEGIYYIQGTPLAETSFANDPEFPAKSSNVCELLCDYPEQVSSVGLGEDIVTTGFMVADVESEEDLEQWVSRMNSDTVYAGGAGFFDAILRKEFDEKPVDGSLEIAEDSKALFIFGSTFPKTVEFMTKLKLAGVMFINLSEEYFQHLDEMKDHIREIAENIAGWLVQNRKVVVTTIFQEEINFPPEIVRNEIGLLVKEVFDLAEINALYIEGGATAAQIIQNLNIKQLTPIRELDYGIIQMEVAGYPGLSLITKPGSYNWPESIIPDTN
ncbi:four-carbon acid sugar kinase family protein [Mangrovibacterium lignilyticum]|uniref:four-carbon acid sugar kinase family protein n=1 Tax=Mangrovibacterium lignilyticum TaxID=2668052 RepID=UPI0013CF7FF9|nr:four-carbon acid sugar kinase family protein [Mangrovibacterium lignilyticum]